MRKTLRRPVATKRTTGPALVIFDACREGECHDCPGVLKQGGRSHVCTCEHHVEAGTVDPKEFGFVEGGPHA